MINGNVDRYFDRGVDGHSWNMTIVVMASMLYGSGIFCCEIVYLFSNGDTYSMHGAYGSA